MQLFWTSDGLHVLRTTSGHKELLGRRVEAINKIPITTVIDSLSTLFTVDNRAIVKSAVPQFISSLQILAYFGFTDTQQAVLTLDGGETHRLKAARPDKSQIVSFEPDSAAFAEQNRNVFFAERYFPDEKIYYLITSAGAGRLRQHSETRKKSQKCPVRRVRRTGIQDVEHEDGRQNRIRHAVQRWRKFGTGNEIYRKNSRFSGGKSAHQHLCRHRT